jgi:hypothetical protein
VNRSTIVSMLNDAVACAARTVPRSVTAATASLGVACVILTTACYTYDLKAPSDLMAGQEVEVTVNNVGRVALTSDLGDDVAQFEGNVVSVADSMLTVSVTHVDYLNGSSTGFPGGTISVSRNSITAVSTKQFSRSKTAVAAFGIVAAIAAVIGVLHATGFGDSGPGSKDPGNGTQIQ